MTPSAVETGCWNSLNTHDRESFEATLRYGNPSVVVAQLAGTVTGIAEIGSVLELGDMVVEVDGAPVIVFMGARPMWRPLREGVANGADVEQLERNLLSLGYLPEDGDDFEPDREFDAQTAEMVEAWRVDVGLSEEPIVELGRILYLDEPARLAEQLATSGTGVAPGVPLVQLTGTAREIEMLLPVDRQDLVGVGDPVMVTMPDDSEVTGTVRSIATSVVAQSGPAGARAVPVTIDLAGDVAVDLDEAPVDVELETSRASGVLAVPVNALLALADGGYGLQIQRGDEPALVGVDIGTFVDGLVEVAGDVVEGDTILVPK